MRTVRCSGVSAQSGGCLPGGRVSDQGAVHLPPTRGQNDRLLWKHNLSATTVADGKYICLTQM